jgi:hypothetical protein
MANTVKDMVSCEEARALAEELVAQGVQPSGNTLVTAAHAAGRPMSKRTALKHLEVLAAQGVTFAPAAPLRTAEDDPVYHTASPVHRDTPSAPEAPAVDPVAVCEQSLQAAERHFFDARDALMQAKLYFIATRNMAVDGILHGTLHAEDEIHQEALADVDEMKRDYDTAWQRREQARYALESAIKRYKRQQQEQWVAVHNKAIVRNLHIWSEKLRTATSDYAHAEAKKNYALVQFAYQQALNEAPTGSLLP